MQIGLFGYRNGLYTTKSITPFEFERIWLTLGRGSKEEEEVEREQAVKAIFHMLPHFATHLIFMFYFIHLLIVLQLDNYCN